MQKFFKCLIYDQSSGRDEENFSLLLPPSLNHQSPRKHSSCSSANNITATPFSFAKILNSIINQAFKKCFIVISSESIFLLHNLSFSLQYVHTYLTKALKILHVSVSPRTTPYLFNYLTCFIFLSLNNLYTSLILLTSILNISWALNCMELGTKLLFILCVIFIHYNLAINDKIINVFIYHSEEPIILEKHLEKFSLTARKISEA